MDIVYQALMGLLALVITWITARVNEYLKQKIKHEGLRNLLSTTSRMALSAVKETAQVYAGALKDAASDGKLTDAEKEEARGKALSALKRNLGAESLSELEKALGCDTKGLESFLLGQLESAVVDLKAGGGSHASKQTE